MPYRGEKVQVAVKRNRLDRLWRILANRWFGTEFSEEKVVTGRVLSGECTRNGDADSHDPSGESSAQSGGVPDIEDVGIIRW